MKTPAFLYTFLLMLVLGARVLAAQPLPEDTDLRERWLVYQDNRLVPFTGQDVSAVYFYLDGPSGEMLKLKSHYPFAVFIDNSFAVEGTEVRLAVDSLRRVFSSSTPLVAIFQEKFEPQLLSTTIAAPEAAGQEADEIARTDYSAFRDYAITAVLILLIMFVVIIRINPKLASDYFSVNRIFSLREMEDTHGYSRIGSSTNILFYAYCSLLLAFYLLVIFHFVGSVYPIAAQFNAVTFGGLVLQWISLSFILLVILILKIILVFTFSYFFGVVEMAGVHFFNWVRVLLISAGTLSAILFIYFIWHGQSEYVHTLLLKLLGWVIGLWIVLLFLKLGSKGSTSMFHLFSYICATEVIPFLFLIKVLYN